MLMLPLLYILPCKRGQIKYNEIATWRLANYTYSLIEKDHNTDNVKGYTPSRTSDHLPTTTFICLSMDRASTRWHRCSGQTSGPLRNNCPHETVTVALGVQGRNRTKQSSWFTGLHRNGDSSVVRAPDSWLKGRRFESLQERWENFLLQGQLSLLTLISVSVPPPCYRSITETIPVILPKCR